MPTPLRAVCRALATLLAVVAFADPAPAATGTAHVHGIARLDIAVEANRISVQLDSPLDNLLGFERAPRTEAERRQVDAALARLRAGASQFRIDPAAQCQLASVDLSSAALRLGKPDAAQARAGQAGHADLAGRFEFDCVDAARAAYIDVGLFEFSHLQGLQVQVATPAGQFRRDLKRPAVRIRLTK